MDPSHHYYKSTHYDSITEFGSGGYSGHSKSMGTLDAPHHTDGAQIDPPHHYKSTYSNDSVTEFRSSGYSGHSKSMGTNGPPHTDGAQIDYVMEAEAQIGNMMQDYIPLQDYIPPQNYIPPQSSLLFLMIKVHGTWDMEFMKWLEALNAPKLLHLFMDLANATWNHMFTLFVVQRITSEVWEKIIDDTCLQQLFIDLECSGIEEVQITEQKLQEEGWPSTVKTVTMLSSFANCEFCDVVHNMV
ncbi:hypothetical protein SCLCIDRAFT_8604 [Scleroderma citrinum Foug A]|uniref:Uncharacterized protein n=1 Tax=Scleroderma citrinum Foug A TaxID=1036808 RepID=A0A0C3DTV7_9AGAM|nr:hypothetical protein SCLCIDRAFT_8604 [Scleroderma citrinum Foug A]